jgi:hypothetical protein
MVHAHDVQAAIDLLALYLGHAQTGQYEGLEI